MAEFITNFNDESVQKENLELARKAKSGDTESMELLIKRFSWIPRSKTRKYFLSGGNDDDLIQEGLLGVFKAILDFDPDKNPNLTAYVNMCVTSQIMDAIRTSSRNKQATLNKAVNIDDLKEDSCPDERDPIDSFIDNESMDSFYSKLNRLITPQQSEILKLYFDGYTYQEISELISVPTKKIDNTLLAIKKKIKQNKELFNVESGD